MGALQSRRLPQPAVAVAARAGVDRTPADGFAAPASRFVRADARLTGLGLRLGLLAFVARLGARRRGKDRSEGQGRDGDGQTGELAKHGVYLAPFS